MNGGQEWALALGDPGYDWASVSFDANDKVLTAADQGTLSIRSRSNNRQLGLPHRRSPDNRFLHHHTK